MADITQLEQALIKADAAGNVDDARALASEIRSLRALESQSAGQQILPPPGQTQPQQAVQPQQIASQQQSQPLEGSLLGGIMGGDDRVRKAGGELIDRGGVLGGVIQGGRDVIDAGAQLLSRAVPQGLADNINQFNNYLADKTGLVGRIPEGGLDEKLAQDEAAYQEARKAAGRSGADIARTAGNIAATLPLSAIPGLQVAQGKGIFDLGNIGRAAVQGGIVGAAQPVLSSGDFGDEKLKQLGYGAAFGAASAPIGAAIGKALQGMTPRKEIKTLLDEGITPTPGQIIGGAAQRAEDKAMSVPFLGDSIKSARKRGEEQLNRAVYRKALQGTGVDASNIPVGREGIGMVKDALSDRYDDLLSKMSFKSDPQFVDELENLRAMARDLAPTEANRFESLLNATLSKMSPNGGMTGETFKIATSKLGKDAASFSKSDDAYQRELGNALSEALRVFRTGIERNNPQLGKELSDLNRGYANYTILRQAGSRAGDMSEGFSPAQLASAVRSADQSVGRGATASGRALMQDLSDAGVNVLSSKYPDSGTAGRVGLLGLLGGSAYMGNIPAAVALTGAGMLPYTQPGQRLAASLLLNRPESVQALGRVVQQSAPFAGGHASTPFSQHNARE